MAISVMSLVWSAARCGLLRNEGELVLLLKLADWANEEGEVVYNRPTCAELGEWVLKKDRSVRGVVKELEGRGLLTGELFPGRGARLSFRVNVEGLREGIECVKKNPAKFTAEKFSAENGGKFARQISTQNGRSIRNKTITKTIPPLNPPEGGREKSRRVRGSGDVEVALKRAREAGRGEELNGLVREGRELREVLGEWGFYSGPRY